MKKMLYKLVGLITLISILTSLVPLSIFATSEVETVSSVSEKSAVGPVKAVTIFNKSTAQCLNYDYGKLANGTTVRTWAYDGEGQIWDIVRISDGVFRIVASANQSFALDIYCPGRELKNGLSADIWKAGGAEAFAQNLIIEYSGEGDYYYLKMANNKSLCITSNGKNNAVKLVSFTGADAQKWYFKDSKAKTSVDITSSSGVVSSSPLPAGMYQKSDTPYIIDGCKYYRATTTSACEAVEVGTFFWIDGSGRVVLSNDLNNKLIRMYYANNPESNLGRWYIQDELDIVYREMKVYSELYLGMNDLSNFASFVGSSSGALISLTANPQLGIKNVALKFVKDQVDLGKIEETILIHLIHYYSVLGEDSAKKAIEILSKDITDYATYEQIYKYIAQVYAANGAVKELTGDEVRKYLYDTSKWDYLLSTLRTTLGSLASSLWPEGEFIPEIIEKIDSGGQAVVNLYDIAQNAKIGRIYNKIYQEHSNKNDDYNHHFIAKKIFESSAEYDKYVANGLAQKLEAVKNKYPEGSTVSHNYQFPKTYAWECHGFACYSLMQFFGTTKPGISNKKSYVSYKATSSNSYVEKIRAGDLVRFRYGKNDHTIVVTNVDESNVYYADCNSDGKCTFKYNRTMSKSELSGYLKKTLIVQQVSTRGYILHYKNNFM